MSRTKTYADHMMDLARRMCVEEQSPTGLTALKLALRQLDKEGCRSIQPADIADLLESVGC